MKKLKIRSISENLEFYANDIQKIVDAFAKRGYEVTPEDACRAWEHYSDAYCCGWICMGSGELSDNEINSLMFYFDEV